MSAKAKYHECALTPACSIVCTIEGKRLAVSHSNSKIPKNIKLEYQKCRERQKKMMLEIQDQRNVATITSECKQTDDPYLVSVLKQSEIDAVRGHLSKQLGRKTVSFPTLLGSGTFGIVVEICATPSFSQVMVVKIAKGGTSLRREFLMQEKFATVGLAVKPIAPYNMSLPYFIMGKVDGTVSDMLKHELLDSELNEIIEQSLQLLYRLCDHHKTHGDLHFANMAYIVDSTTKRKVFFCLDFGSILPGCDAEIDLLQFIRDTYNEIYHEYNKDYLRMKFHAVYERNYGPLDLNLSQISRYRLQLLHAHNRHISQPQHTKVLAFTEDIDLNTDTDSDSNSDSDSTDVIEDSDEGDEGDEGNDTENNSKEDW